MSTTPSTSAPVVSLRFRPSFPHNSNEENDDIYRGNNTPPQRSLSLDSTTSSSSSSSYFRTGGRLGVIAAIVEQAITRWARANSSSSSIPPPSSSRSSILTTSRSQIRRRRRRTSTGNPHSIQSERDVAARIKAREEARHVPREFCLYLPPLGRTASAVEGQSQVHLRRVAKTSSLHSILGQLDTTLKKSAKAWRNKDRIRSFKSPAEQPHVPSLPHHDLPSDIRAPSRPASFTDLRALHRTRKGKNKDATSSTLPLTDDHENQKAPKAWWLDVSSPTWEDIRAIGKVCRRYYMC